MRLCKHGCDMSRVLIGYVLSDARLDWLVGNISIKLCKQRLGFA